MRSTAGIVSTPSSACSVQRPLTVVVNAMRKHPAMS